MTIPPVLFQKDPNWNIFTYNEIFVKDMPQHNDNGYSMLGLKTICYHFERYSEADTVTTAAASWHAQ